MVRFQNLIFPLSEFNRLNLFGIGQSASIDVTLDNLTNRKLIETKLDQSQTCLLPVFYNGETISGKVSISLKRGSKLEYQGIKIELIGHIDFFADRGSRDEFLNLTQDLARPGILSQASTSYPFRFENVEMPYESYAGSNVHLRYFLRVTVVKRFMDLTKELDFLVHSFYKPQQPDTNIQMEVGIEESLHIEFEYNKSCYHLEDVIVGKIYFQLVRVKIKYMEVQILRRESTGLGAVNTFTEMETMAKFEIMDGAPVRGECIPIRLFLGAYEQLTPTAKDVNRKFSVRFYINLVLLDEEERRYYKQHEIFLYRRPDKRYEAFIQNQQTSTIMALKNFSMHPQNHLHASSKPIVATSQPVPTPYLTSEGTDVAQSKNDEKGQGDVADSGKQENGSACSSRVLCWDVNYFGNFYSRKEYRQKLNKFMYQSNQMKTEQQGTPNVGEMEVEDAQMNDSNGVVEESSPETEENDQVQDKNGAENPVETPGLEVEEKDVFSGLSDQEEDNAEEGISREQRSFARYESPRDAVNEEGENEERCEAGEITIKKPPMEAFESTPTSTTKAGTEATSTVS